MRERYRLAALLAARRRDTAALVRARVATEEALARQEQVCARLQQRLDACRPDADPYAKPGAQARVDQTGEVAVSALAVVWRDRYRRRVMRERQVVEVRLVVERRRLRALVARAEAVRTRLHRAVRSEEASARHRDRWLADARAVRTRRADGELEDWLAVGRHCDSESPCL